jgi:hypothetical protein
MTGSLYHIYRNNYIIDNGLKSSIPFRDDDLRIAGSTKEPDEPNSVKALAFASAVTVALLSLFCVGKC